VDGEDGKDDEDGGDAVRMDDGDRAVGRRRRRGCGEDTARTARAAGPVARCVMAGRR
jgi:hypothetical protein